MGNHFSIILLPTNKCNVNCEYCFEDKTSDRMTLDQLSLLTRRVLDYMDEASISRLMVHWQGGEIMTMPAEWFAAAYDLMGDAAAARGKTIEHGLQSNMIAYHPRWDDVIERMFGNGVGTSMDFPNIHRKLFNGSAREYTLMWERNVRTARDRGIRVAAIAVPNQATIDTGAERFYSYFVDRVGLDSFQVNTPFPGGTQNDAKRSLGLDVDELGAFMADLTDVWLERGYSRGVAMDPMAELVKQFMDAGSCLPCIWQSNCADEFISIDARGYVAQCDCWVTSYPEYFFGNIFKEESLGRMLRESRTRQDFVKRPAAVIPQDCIECDYLSLCHGGCPVRTYSFRGTMFEKDPYCHTYLAMFRKAEEVAKKLSGNRARGLTLGSRAARISQNDIVSGAGTAPPPPVNLVQIQRRPALNVSH